MQRCLIVLCLIAVLVQPATATKYPQAEWMARFYYRPFPAYPAYYRRLRMTGNGLYRLHVTEQGRVASVTVLKSAGHKELDILSRNALLLWRGKSGHKWELDIPITFSMDMSHHLKDSANVKTYR